MRRFRIFQQYWRERPALRCEIDAIDPVDAARKYARRERIKGQLTVVVSPLGPEPAETVVIHCSPQRRRR